MAIKYYIKAAVSEYQDKDGKAKKKYQSIGIILETKNGLMLKLETIPLFSLKDGCLIAYLNDPEPIKDPFPKSLADIPDDLPFQENMMSQYELIVIALSKWISPLDALHKAGTMKLSTRVGELRAKGYIIEDRWHESRKFKMYKLVSKP